jgi:hypothetical protein
MLTSPSVDRMLVRLQGGMMSKVLWDVTIVKPGAQEDVVYGTMEKVSVYFDPWLYRATLKDEEGEVIDTLTADPKARAVIHEEGVTIYRLVYPHTEQAIKLKLAPHQ